MTTSEREQRGRRGPVRQVPLPARPRRTAAGVTSPGNTAEPSGELDIGDVVVIGEAALAAGRPIGWTPVSGGLNESRADQHGTHPLPDPGRGSDTGT
jgi:hypothetical protein